MGKMLIGMDENSVIYVKCGQPKCGISKIDGEKFTRSKRETEDISHEVKAARIVGGSSALPGEFPFIVAIFKDGRFHCGGSIYNERWILTGN
jgi:secreted trypsin-like serine protease